MIILMAYFPCVTVVYIIVGVYGLIFLFRGLKAIIQRQVIVEYGRPHFSFRELITFSERSAALTGSDAARWGAGQVISGLLSCLPWLYPLLSNIHLEGNLFTLVLIMLALIPFTGLGLNIIVSQVMGRRANNQRKQKRKTKRPVRNPV